MANLRKIAEVTATSAEATVTAKVYRDAKWNEYRVRFYFNGQLNPEADYFTTDKQDALDTANSIKVKEVK